MESTNREASSEGTTSKGKGRAKEGEGTGWREEQSLRKEASTVPQTRKEEGGTGDNEIQSLHRHFGNTQWKKELLAPHQAALRPEWADTPQSVEFQNSAVLC